MEAILFSKPLVKMDVKNFCFIDGEHEIQKVGYTLRLEGDTFKDMEGIDIVVKPKELLKLERIIKKEKGKKCEYIELAIIRELFTLVKDETHLCYTSHSVLFNYMAHHIKRYFVLRKIRFHEPVPVFCEYILCDDEL